MQGDRNAQRSRWPFDFRQVLVGEFSRTRRRRCRLQLGAEAADRHADRGRAERWSGVDAAREAGARHGPGPGRDAVACCAGAYRVGRAGRVLRRAGHLCEARWLGEAGGLHEAGGARRVGLCRQAEVMRAVVVAAALVVVGCHGSSTPSPPITTGPESKDLLKEGDPAPPLVATAANGANVDLAALKGKHVVVYFYPKDDTPGCTKEACAFRDAWSKLEKGNIQVIGVSVDDNESHKKFAAKHNLPFPLVADPDKKICKAFGVPVTMGFASRVSFLIGPDGKIKKVYPKVDPGVHANEILADAGVT